MTVRTMIDCPYLVRVMTFIIAIGLFTTAKAAFPVPPTIDERWIVTVNGQTIRVETDGTFRLPNIAAADVFGPTGPGSPPDFKSDEWFQVVGTAMIDGVTWYATDLLPKS